jgi:hypothetical protein
MYCGYRYVLWLPVCTVTTGMYCGYRYVLWLPVCTVATGMYCDYRYVLWLPVCIVATGMYQLYGVYEIFEFGFFRLHCVGDPRMNECGALVE